jgi:hypothetical protein
MKRTVLSVIICVLCAAMLISSLGVSARAGSIDTVAFHKITGRSWVSDRNCSHSWVRATCTTPGYCTKCKVTNEKALGHSWVSTVDSSGVAGRICANCKEMETLVYNWIPLTSCEKVKASNEEAHFADIKVGDWTARAGKLENSLRFCVSGKESYKKVHHITYKLGGNFDTMSGLVSFMEKSDAYATAKIQIYLDDELAFDSGTISDLSNDKSFTLDVRDVKMVRIVCSTQDKHTAYCVLSASVF